MSDPVGGSPTASERGGPMRVDVTPSVVGVTPGEEVHLIVEITNTDDVIREVSIGVLGLDATWARVEPPTVSMFPDERASAIVWVTLPDDFPAGRRHAAIEVVDVSDPLPPAIVEVELEITARQKVEVRVEPSNVVATRKAMLSATVTNPGNAPLDVELVATDPEGLLRTKFLPDRLTLQPGQGAVVQLESSGKRPWLGTPQVRPLTVEARGRAASTDRADIDLTAAESHDEDDGDEPGAGISAPAGPVVASDMALTTITQRPWLSRRLLSIAGLLAAASVLALVFTSSFGSVADVAQASQDILKQSLGSDVAASRAEPTVIGGSVEATTGTPIDGVAIELFDITRGPALPVRTTVTDQTGTFRFAGLASGAYRVKVSGAGFDEIWYPEATSYDDAQDIEVELGQEKGELAFVLSGLPASVRGIVLGDDVAGAVVTVRVPAGAPTSSPGGVATDAIPVPAIVSTATVDVTGEFELSDLPTPAVLEVVAEKADLRSEVRTVRLDPGDSVDEVALLLLEGDGVISGRVVDRSGTGVPGATIKLSEGLSTRTSQTLSGGPDTAGRFEIRDLSQHPATFSLTVTAEGYFSDNQSIVLDAQQSRTNIEVVLVPSTGQLGGRVRDSGNTPLGGVTVTIIGEDATRTSMSLTEGDVGSWLVSGLTVPGSYTVTFSATGLSSQTLAVDLSVDSPARHDVDIRLTSSVASVQGLVREMGSESDGGECDPNDAATRDCPGRLSGVVVTLSSSSFTRRTVTADAPTGAFRFDNVPPGAYTITFARAGSTSQTVFVELAAGEQRVVSDVYLEPQARITGTASSEDVLLPGVEVRIYKINQYPFVPAMTTYTDASGRYEAIGLDAPEVYVVEFRYQGLVFTSADIFLSPGQSGVADGEL